MRKRYRSRYINTIQNSEYKNGSFYRNRSRYDIFCHVAEKFGYKVTYVGSRAVKVIVEKQPSFPVGTKSILTDEETGEASLV